MHPHHLYDHIWPWCPGRDVGRKAGDASPPEAKTPPRSLARSLSAHPSPHRLVKMAIGKNKRLTKGKKGGKKKVTDPFLRKEQYVIRAPSMFATRNAGKTIITRTQGTKIASEGLKNRVFEISLADLNGGDESQAYRKIRLVAEDVQGTNVITNFHGMDITRDKLCSLIRKWQTLIDAHIDVRTTDGYLLRVFAIAFTKKQSNQAVKSTCYAQAGQVRNIRKTIFEIISEEATKCDLKELVQKL